MAVTLNPRGDRGKDLLEAFTPHYNRYLRIDGWLSDKEATALYACAASIKQPYPVAVEIGSYQGRSSVCIAGGLLDGGQGGTLYCVDPFDGTDEGDYLVRRDRTGVKSLYEKFLENTKDYPNITPVVGFSQDAARESVIPDVVDMIFIDGNHTYDAVKADILTWVPYLRKDGGILAMHDVQLPAGKDPDPIRVIADLALGSFDFGWKQTMLTDTLYLTVRSEKEWTILAL